ncbi:hypothetical protein Hanom_Chr03g00246981 [Helianthus anomalus]
MAATNRKPIPVEIQARITNFFVNNLPDRCSGVDVATALRGMGTIFDIYIAGKRNKEGKKIWFHIVFGCERSKGDVGVTFRGKHGRFQTQVQCCKICSRRWGDQPNEIGFLSLPT